MIPTHSCSHVYVLNYSFRACLKRGCVQCVACIREHPSAIFSIERRSSAVASSRSRSVSDQHLKSIHHIFMITYSLRHCLIIQKLRPVSISSASRIVLIIAAVPARLQGCHTLVCLDAADAAGRRFSALTLDPQFSPLFTERKT